MPFCSVTGMEWKTGLLPRMSRALARAILLTSDPGEPTAVLVLICFLPQPWWGFRKPIRRRRAPARSRRRRRRRGHLGPVGIAPWRIRLLVLLASPNLPWPDVFGGA